ncbi:unnamed protein product [Amoebophrya sp. A25]|nr:unnamed protein product [Amoebophrya sp. A25]|eukprot:GSA25T00001888001.1
MNHSPAQVSQWLSSMLNIIPGDILSLLAQRVKTTQVSGHTFSGMLNNHEFFNEMGIEGLTMLHCSRIRKVWHQDFPDTRHITLDRRPNHTRRDANPQPQHQQMQPGGAAGMRPPAGRNPMSRMHHPDGEGSGDPRAHTYTADTSDRYQSRRFQSADGRMPGGGPSGMSGMQNVPGGGVPMSGGGRDPSQGMMMTNPAAVGDPHSVGGGGRYVDSAADARRMQESDREQAAAREENMRLAHQIQKMQAQLSDLTERLQDMQRQRDEAINKLDMKESSMRAREEEHARFLDYPRQVFETVCNHAGLDKAAMYPAVREYLQPVTRGSARPGSQKRPADPRQIDMRRQPPGAPEAAYSAPSQPQLGGRIVGDPFDPKSEAVLTGAQQRRQAPPPPPPQHQEEPPQARPVNPFDDVPASAHHRILQGNKPQESPPGERTTSSRGGGGQGAPPAAPVEQLTKNGKFNPSFEASEELRPRAEEKSASSSSRPAPKPKIAAAVVSNARANGKSPRKIIDWIKSLPDAFVPERVKDQMCGHVDGRGIDGSQFTQLVMTNQLSAIGVVSPLQVSKIVKAWKNVLAEDQMANAAMETANANNLVDKKAVKLIC